MRKPSAWIPLLLITATALNPALAGDQRPFIWVLPFEHLQDDSSVDHLAEAIPALLEVAVSRSEEYSLVDRRHLDQVLAEHAVALEGLSSAGARRRIGGLLGATMIISGSFARQGEDLLITMRASDLGTGIVSATVEGRGPAGQPGQLVSKLYRQLARNLDRRLPDLAPVQIDEAPAGNLHFMKGLGHFYSARYSHALAEFLLAGGDHALTEISRLWLANTYMAQHQYPHAYLELIRLASAGSMTYREKEVAAKIRECERHLSTEDVKTIRELAAHRAPSKE